MSYADSSEEWATVSSAYPEILDDSSRNTSQVQANPQPVTPQGNPQGNFVFDYRDVKCFTEPLFNPTNHQTYHRPILVCGKM